MVAVRTGGAAMGAWHGSTQPVVAARGTASGAAAAPRRAGRRSVLRLLCLRMPRCVLVQYTCRTPSRLHTECVHRKRPAGALCFGPTAALR